MNNLKKASALFVNSTFKIELPFHSIPSPKLTSFFFALTITNQFR